MNAPRMTTDPNIMTARKAYRTVTTDGYRLLAEAVLWLWFPEAQNLILSLLM
jgi:hypothetical protein